MLGFPLFCPAKSLNRGPGLLSIRSRVTKNSWIDTYPFGRTDTRMGRYSLAVLLWGLLPEVNIYTVALREAFLPTLQVFLFLEPLFYPCRFSCRKLPFSPTKLDLVCQLSFTAVAGSAICISNELYKGEHPVEGVLTHVVVPLLHALTN